MTLEFFKAKDTGLRKGLVTINNMFIWNTKDNTVSDKKIYTEFSDIIINLRNLYNNYFSELKNINDKKVFDNIKSIIVRTEIIVNLLYINYWDIQKIKNDKNKLFLIYIDVTYKDDSILLLKSLERLNKIKKFNPNKIAVITIKIIESFNKLKIKAEKLLE